MGTTVGKYMSSRKGDVIGTIIDCRFGLCVIVKLSRCSVKVMKLDGNANDKTIHELGKINRIKKFGDRTEKNKHIKRYKWLEKRFFDK